MRRTAEFEKAAALLQALYDDALHGKEAVLPPPLRDSLGIIIEHSDTSRAVLAVTLTLLLKKAASPRQDIRKHQAGMAGGFSGRGLDEKVVTPFLRNADFPYMQSGSGWLTRSLEQNRPYNDQYPGKIKPAAVKNAFLAAVDAVQKNAACAKPCLVHVLAALAKRRDARKDILLERPTDLDIYQIIERLGAHFAGGRGAARLPVLAVYAVYQQLMKEVKKYDGCVLEELQAHTSADGKTGQLGDIQISSQEGRAVEAVEIKHNVQLTPALVRACHDKIKKTPVKTYYLLSTNDALADAEGIIAAVKDIRSGHGCQMIVNGLLPTLKYYLRLLKDTSAFVDNYATLLEKEQAVPYALKIRWNGQKAP